MFKSKRFWLTLSAIVTSVGSAATGTVDKPTALQAIVASILGLVVSYAYRDPKGEQDDSKN